MPPLPMDISLEELRKTCASSPPHPAAPWLEEACKQVTALVIHDYLRIADAPIGKTADRAAMEALLREPPPETGAEFTKVLDEVFAQIAPNTMLLGNPRFLAFIPGAPTFVSMLGDWLCAALNVFAGVWKEASAATEVEILVLDWFKEFLGYPPQARGILTSGGSEANLTALIVARERLDWADRQRAVVYVSEQRHWSVDRAAKIIGLRPEEVHRLPADAEHRLAPQTLTAALAADRRNGVLPWLVVANAGSTNTGSIDALDQLDDVCRANGLWLHVDAAYGWPAVLTAEGKAALRGIERADSITLDPHKWFAQTFDAGCVLVRDGKRLAETFQIRPEYMQDVAPGAEEINFADHGIALTRRFRALKIWFSLKVLGVGWFRGMVEHCLRLTDYSQALLERAGCFEILSPRQLSIVCFRYLPPTGKCDEAALDALNLELCERVQRTGRAFLSTTRLRGSVCLRLCFVNWRTTAADVEEVVRILDELGHAVSREAQPSAG